MKEEITGNDDFPFFVAGTAAGTTSVLTVGYVLWTIRSGWLVTSVIAQMPAWRLIDPLVVLNYFEETNDLDEDDSLETMIDQAEANRDEDESQSNTNLSSSTEYPESAARVFHQATSREIVV